MATRRGQSELRRRLSAALPVALTAALAFGAVAHAQVQPSGYEPHAGEPFFLLSDKAWGSHEVALVRVEANAWSIGEYGGVDVVLYRVPEPIGFLEKQKNLHRIRVDALPAEEGLANTVSHLWDRWYSATRQAWRRLFSPEIRGTVTARAPELKTQHIPSTRFRHPPQFRPLPGLTLVTRFRYPVHQARPIQPPAEVKLAGSSSEFTDPPEGNVMVPLGRLAPGLYLVEAYVGAHRANTLVFVSDTVTITKASATEMLVWTAERHGGTAVHGVDVAWTDGAGVLARGRTDARGVVRLTHEAPERSYVFGTDPQGGAFISENFYYDSEIYDTKLYAVTDRPLYRPDDTVFVKVFGREFKSARVSVPASPGEVDLTVLDPAGAPVARQKLVFQSETGGDTSFRLPENAGAGGYELRMAYKGSTYSAAFRVAEYTKPHFEVAFVQEKDTFKVKEPVHATVQMRYTDGKPVANAEVQLTVRSQQLTMVDGELGYYGQFPVKLSADVLKTDARGELRLELPAVEEPSRYVVTLLASDGSASRVRMTRELLVERGRSSFTLRAARQFSAPGEKVAFVVTSAEGGTPPRTWEWVRLEDRHRENGSLAAADRLEIAFAAPGTYSLQLRDERGDVVGATSHWVSGGGLKAPAGSISMVTSRERYRPGETADVLITFPTEVQEALLTLERDKVESAALLRSAPGWVRTEKLGPNQWRARIPVDASFAPNITFSVAYVKDGEYVFQNQGLVVTQPRVEVGFKANKAVYAPGERVEVDVRTTIDGKGRPAVVAVGVVDEMIYVLQPEIAPPLEEFFFHLRRNNVRTSSSLAFISYDLATSRSKGAPQPGSVSERRVKLLERPRRDEVDTAFWNPTLRTDGSGRAKFTFVMPDALTRWRLTGRAMAADGTVGQRTSYVRSEKPVYLKWTSPDWKRVGDAPTATIAAFNQTSRVLTADLAVTGGGLARREAVTLQPGINVLMQPLAGLTGDGPIQVSLQRDGKTVDALQTRFAHRPVDWRSPRTTFVPVAGIETPLALPADARDLEVQLVSGAAAQFRRVASDLLDYPYGCIEQTASRMIPLALGIESLPAGERRVADRLRQRLHSQRLRLAYMAGPKATFTWWGVGTADDPFVTAYAYYADSIAVRTLGLTVPVEHWNRLLDVYRDKGHALPVSQRVLVLSFMQEMGLPVTSLADALFEDLGRVAADTGSVRLPPSDSPFLGEPDGRLAHAMADVLAARLAKLQGRSLPAALATRARHSASVLRASGTPVAEAVLLASGDLPSTETERVLGRLTREMPTLERALALAWIRTPMAGATPPLPAPGAPWVSSVDDAGTVTWRWPATEPLPRALLLPSASSGVTAVVRFTSAAREEHQLPVAIGRRLLRLTKTEDTEQPWQLAPVEEGEPLSTTGLYLDEISLAPQSASYRYGILEVPLPPGASVESTTWGIDLPDDEGKLRGLEKARHQPTSFGYAVPVDPVSSSAGPRPRAEGTQDPLSGPVVVRHLLRFGQKGSYVVPRARLYRMYQPEAKAFEDGAASRWAVQ